MRLKIFWKILTILVFVAAFAQLVFIDTEFSMADNTDFNRYLSFLEKPCSVSKNMPAVGTKEWQLRYKAQPQMYWDFSKTPRKCWFSSAELFWNCGKTVNQWFFSTKVFSMKYTGFLHYLIHALVLAVFFAGVLKKQKWFCLVIFPILLLSVDAVFNRFYNTFYAESIPILFLQCLLIYVAWLVFFSEDSCHWKNTYPYVLFLAVMLIFAGISKRQYLPLCLINVLLVVCVLINAKYSKKDRVSKIVVSVVILISTILAILVWRANVDAGGQNSISHINKRHALYYGVLMSSKHPEALIQKLGLPQETIKSIGYSYWGCPKEMVPIMRSLEISPKQVIQGFIFDPGATLDFYYQNLSQLAQFQTIKFGCVPCVRHGYPPDAAAVYSNFLIRFSGGIIFFVACGISILLCIFSFGLDKFHHNMLRAFLAFFLILVILDVATSMFDGRTEVTKHIMAANFSVMAIYALFFAALGNFLHQIIDRQIHVPFFSKKSLKKTVGGKDVKKEETVVAGDL